MTENNPELAYFGSNSAGVGREPKKRKEKKRKEKKRKEKKRKANAKLKKLASLKQKRS